MSFRLPLGAVIADVRDDAFAMAGAMRPLALINPARDLSEAIGKSNEFLFGRSAYAFMRSRATVQRLSVRD